MAVFNNLIGKRINAIFMGDDDWTIVFRTVEGTHYQYQTQKDCCNTVWVNHLSGMRALGAGDNNSFDLLRGAMVLSAEDKEWTENRNWADDDGGEYGDVIQDGFYTITTDRGQIDIEVRNSHNGYYGGSFDEVENVALDSIDNLKQVFDDF